MTVPKKYFHDRLVLLLLSINTFLAIIIWPLILLKLGGGQSSYFVEYRANLGVSPFKTGKVTDILAFLVFVTIIYVFHLVMSIKLYRIRRPLALAMLSLGLLLEVLALIVSNALLALH